MNIFDWVFLIFSVIIFAISNKSLLLSECLTSHHLVPVEATVSSLRLEIIIYLKDIECYYAEHIFYLGINMDHNKMNALLGKIAVQYLSLNFETPLFA